MASLYKLPCIFVVENNLWAIGMQHNRATNPTAGDDSPYIYKKGPAFGMPGILVDGMDVRKVFVHSSIVVMLCVSTCRNSNIRLVRWNVLTLERRRLLTCCLRSSNAGVHARGTVWQMKQDKSCNCCHLQLLRCTGNDTQSSVQTKSATESAAQHIGGSCLNVQLSQQQSILEAAALMLKAMIFVLR